MTLDASKQYSTLKKYKSQLRYLSNQPYTKPALAVLTLVLFVLSSKNIGVQIILQGLLIALGLAAVIFKVPSSGILRPAFVAILLIPISNIVGADNMANVATIYAFLILCAGILAAIAEEIRHSRRNLVKKSKKA